MKEILEELRARNHYGGGYFVEFAKGSHQKASNWSIGMRKIKRTLKRK